MHNLISLLGPPVQSVQYPSASSHCHHLAFNRAHCTSALSNARSVKFSPKQISLGKFYKNCSVGTRSSNPDSIQISIRGKYNTRTYEEDMDSLWKDAAEMGMKGCVTLSSASYKSQLRIVQIQAALLTSFFLNCQPACLFAALHYKLYDYFYSNSSNSVTCHHRNAKSAPPSWLRATTLHHLRQTACTNRRWPERN